MVKKGMKRNLQIIKINRMPIGHTDQYFLVW